MSLFLFSCLLRPIPNINGSTYSEMYYIINEIWISEMDYYLLYTFLLITFNFSIKLLTRNVHGIKIRIELLELADKSNALI